MKLSQFKFKLPEVVIESDDKVFPMVAPGKNLEDCFDEKDLQKQQ